MSVYNTIKEDYWTLFSVNVKENRYEKQRILD